MTGSGTRRRGRAKGPSLWTLAAALVVIAMASFAGANRVGGEVGRLERAERLSYLLEARAYEQAALDSRATSTGALDEAMARRAAAIRQELTAALAELAALHPDDPAVRRVRAAAVDWQATLDTKLALLAAGDLVAANRVDRAQVDPGFERLAALLRTTAADYSRAAGAAQGRSKAGVLAVVVAAGVGHRPDRGPAQGPGGGMTATWPAGPARRVLLVDDNRGFRQELRLLLEDCGIEVVAEGENGQEAVELATRTDADVVLMDLRMPVMDGLQAARALRDQVPSLPVIILSAYEDPALKSEADAANAYAYLVKGCSGGLVLETIEQAWASRSGASRN